jgi:hypothetical protein
MSDIPVSTEARARVRRWKIEALARFERINAVIESDAFAHAGQDFAYKRKLGKRRALLTAKALLREAHFERAHLTDPAYALWSFIHPRESVTAPGEGVAPSLLQECAVVDFVCIGKTWNHLKERLGTGRSRGLWSVEIRAHAIGRLAQREPHADFDSVIFEAHHEALRIKLVPDKGASFLIPAGPGAFVCTLTAGKDTAFSRTCFCIAAHTWVHVDGITGVHPFAEISTVAGMRLGDSLLMPVGLQHWIAPEILKEMGIGKSEVAKVGVHSGGADNYPSAG